MFSLGHKEENAHTESIYSCAWSRYKIEDQNDDDEMAGQKEYQDFILTAGLDNVIKLWNIREDSSLELKNQLNGHSLGVVSVDVSPDGRSKWNLSEKKLNLKSLFSQQSQAVLWIQVFVSGKLRMVL